MRLDIGCGQALKPGFTGVDIHPFPHVTHVCDVTEGLPFESGSVEEIYSSHSLEHLAEKDVAPFLKECFRVLRPGGRLELIVPDLPAVLQSFLDTPEESRWGFPLETIFGHQSHGGQFHKTGFSNPRLVMLLDNTGFKVESCENLWDKGQTSIRALSRKPILGPR